jgi:hypothetical protein
MISFIGFIALSLSPIACGFFRMIIKIVLVNRARNVGFELGINTYK